MLFAIKKREGKKDMRQLGMTHRRERPQQMWQSDTPTSWRSERLPEAGGAVTGFPLRRVHEAFKGSPDCRKVPVFVGMWKKQEKGDFGPVSHTRESLRISYRGNRVGEINLIGDIDIYPPVHNHGSRQGMLRTGEVLEAEEVIQNNGHKKHFFL